VRNVKTIIAHTLLCFCLFPLWHIDSLAQERAPAREVAWQKLLALKDQDLYQFESQRKRIERLANLLIPYRNDKRFNPRFLWSVTTPANEKRLVLVDLQDGMNIPGVAVHDLYFFDEAGKLLGTSRIQTGWRQWNNDVRIIRKDELGLSLLEVSTVGLGFTSYRTTRQFYALLEDRAVLVRLEDNKAVTIRSSYGCEYPAFGLPQRHRDADEWAKALASSDTVEVLQALMWLGGHHIALEELEYQKGQSEDWKTIQCPEEATADTKLFLEVSARNDVRQTLLRLNKSSNDWVRQAAELAIKPAELYRLFSQAATGR
jgi:hypothetical protein